MNRIHSYTGLTVLCIALATAGCSRNPARTYQGYVEGEFVHVASSGSGRLERLQVARGDQVAAEAPLFVLESEPEASVRRQAQEQLTAAEAQLKDIQSGKRPQECDVLHEQVAQAEAEARRSSADQARDEAQFQAGGIPQSQLDRTRATAEAASARVRELAGQLAVAGLPAREAQITAQSAQVAAARAVLDQAEWRWKQKNVTAPAAGLVSDTLYREGEWVPAGRPVVRLLPPANVKVRFFIPETGAGRLSIGQKVVLHCGGSPADVPARVTYISEEAEYTSSIIYSEDSRSKLVFLVEARPLDASAGLHPGQPAQVSVP